MKVTLTQEEQSFLKENWKNLDTELEKQLGISISSVGHKRRNLGLNKKRGKKPGEGLKSKLNREWLAKVLQQEGETFHSIANKFGVTLERVRQVGKDWDIQINRTPAWWAQYYGLAWLADKSRLEQELKAANGALHLARKINISPNKIRAQAKRLGINPWLLKYHRQMVEITCQVCGKKKKRPKVEIDRCQHTFCSQSCHGKWLAVNSGKSLWSEGEKRFIKDNYQKMTDAQMAVVLRRSQGSVCSERSRILGLKKWSGHKWTEEDIALVKANLNLTDKQLAAKFGVTDKAMSSLRYRQGILKRKA